MDTSHDVVAYVRSAANLLDLPLDDAQVQRVALHLARTQAMAAALKHLPLASRDELPDIFCPAPFPAEDPA